MKIAMLTKMSPERKYKLECFINCHVLINNENEGQHSECFNNMVTWSDIQLYIVQSCISNHIQIGNIFPLCKIQSFVDMQKNKVLSTYITFKLWQQTGCQLSIWQNSEAAAGNNIYKALFPNSFLTQKRICKYLIETMNKITRNAADNYLQTFYLCSVTHTHYIVVSYSNW